MDDGGSRNGKVAVATEDDVFTPRKRLATGERFEGFGPINQSTRHG